MTAPLCFGYACVPPAPPPRTATREIDRLSTDDDAFAENGWWSSTAHALTREAAGGDADPVEPLEVAVGVGGRVAGGGGVHHLSTVAHVVEAHLVPELVDQGRGAAGRASGTEAGPEPERAVDDGPGLEDPVDLRADEPGSRRRGGQH